MVNISVEVGGGLEGFYCVYICSKTSLNRPTMGPTLSGAFREVVGLGSWNISMGGSFGIEIK